jgi:hypothetical protein
LLRGFARFLGLSAGVVLIAGATGWGALALNFDGPGPDILRTALASAFAAVGLAALMAFLLPRTRRLAAACFAVLFAILLGWWLSIEGSNDRDWQPEVARLPYATFEGDLVTVHDIRNFDYRTETDFTPGYYDKTFNLRGLDSVDLIASYWTGPAIAHLFLSFGFGEDHLAISIEARKERNEGYSTVRGFFKQYELIYIVGDERDLIRLRTNYRKDPPEDVYLFRAHGPIENGRRIFLDYMRTINKLREKPRFYNTLTANCTNVILLHARMNPGHPPYSWKILLSGYAPEYVYERGKLDTSLPFPELMRRSRVNDAARAADAAPDFSQRIRAALPPAAPAGS